MDCQEFELNITDFARHDLTNMAMLKRAILHAEICSACARRVNYERRLTAVLQTVAADSVNDGAPARVETNLLNAFRAQYRKETTANTPTTSKVVSFASRQPRAARFAWRRLATGAALLAACLALIFSAAPRAWRQTNETTPAQQAKIVSPALPLDAKNVFDKTTSRAAVDAPKVDSVKTGSRTSPRIAQTARSNHKFDPHDLARSRRTNGLSDSANAMSANAETEIATDFLFLTTTTRDALEGGQIVRVELPHSALADFGLPVNAASLGEKVKADVVLSADGVARAIRFVR